MTREEIIQLVQETFFADTEWVNIGKAGFTPKKEWQNNINYEELDVVQYEGSLYIALEDNSNKNPAEYEDTVWMLAAEHGQFTAQQLEDFKAEVVAESKQEMDDYTDGKKTELDTYEETKETELNTYATGLKNDFDSNATEKTTAFNTNASEKNTQFNNNASDKTETFDANASTKTTAFNDNATSETNAFNTNATNKTTDFNDNATAKTTAFDANASDKTDDFNNNATAKTTAFDENAEAKTDEFDEHTEEIQADIEDLQNEVEELSANMPWNKTEQATGLQVTDAAKYSKNKLELFGNTEQIQYRGINLYSTTVTPAIRGYLYNNRFVTRNTFADLSTYFRCEPNTTYTVSRQILTSAFRVAEYDSEEIPTSTSTQQSYTVINEIDNNNGNSITITTSENAKMLLIHYGNMATDTSKVAESSKNSIQIEKGSTATEFEPYTGGLPRPNPAYPQDIHVVTGNNIIKVNIDDDIVLPTGYKRLDYIENTGSEYIDTNFTPTDKTKIEFEFKIDTFDVPGTDNYSSFCGSDSASVTNKAFALLLSKTRNNIRYDFYNHTYSTVGAKINENTKYKCTFNKQGVFINDSLYGAVSDTYYNDEEFTSQDTLHLFNVTGVTSVPNSIYKLYSFKIYESNTLIKDFIPCKNPNNEVGLYDIVNNVFYSNQGTGSFIAGEDLNEYRIDLGNIELCKIGDYQDYLYKENGNWYKYEIITKTLLDGHRVYTKSNIYSNEDYLVFFLRTGFTNLNSDCNIYCDKFIQGDIVVLTNQECMKNSTQLHIRILASRLNGDTAEDYKTWLASNNLTVYYGLATPTITRITDETLISQLDAIYEHLKLVKGTNNITVTAQDLAPNMQLTYMQDLPSKLDKLEAMIIENS